MLTDIRCLLMRGGTSKGPYFLAQDMPADAATRDRVLLAVMGSPHVRQIDGIGGGDSLTSKAVIVGRSARPGIDLDYLFAQIAVGKEAVDTAPNCGNMLAGVGPFALERGLMRAGDPATTIRIFNINTGKVIEAVVPTPGGVVTYDGDAKIDGVPGTGAPIVLNFLDAAGAKTGRLLPTGRPIDVVDGIEVSCVDLASPLVFVRAADLGRTGYETKRELDADPDLIARIESLRRRAALLMGLGDVAGKVLPKFALVAPPRGAGDIAGRYFVPWNCHSAFAVTGALCLGAAACIPGTVAHAVVRAGRADSAVVVIEHPAGSLETRMTVRDDPGSSAPVFERAGILRTARPLLEGFVHIADDVWAPAAA
ncbi:MAG: 4-oxalomesaconate tautomerase [Burkholderiales bacterium]